MVDAHRMKSSFPPGWFGEFEEELHRRVMEFERDLVAEVMESNDVEAEAIEIGARRTGACCVARRRT